MKSCSGFFKTGLLARFAIFFVLLVVVIAAGLFLGKISVSKSPRSMPVETTPDTASRPASAPDEGQPESEQDKEAPVFLHIGGSLKDNWEVARAQIVLASEAGIHHFIAPVALNWEETIADGQAGQAANELLAQCLEVNNQAKFLLWVNLNPPVSWLERHPEAAVKVKESFQAYPSIASPLWLETARQRLEKMIIEVESGPHKPHIIGYGLAALVDQRWMLTPDFDESAANTESFRRWLQDAYGSEDALKSAWGSADAQFAGATIPGRPAAGDTCVFLAQLPGQQPLVDFYRYCSEKTADALAGFASLTARISMIDPVIAAPYGFSFEALPGSSGHFAVELLLESDIDVFVAPVSYADRGLGGVGGMMGIIDSMKVRGKTWYILDDTRTGVEKNAETGEFARIKGIRAEDVYEVQRRNFSMAMTYGLGLIWSDPQGEGWLNDKEQWQHLGKLKDIYNVYNQEKEDIEGAEKPATLTVVLDESPNFYLQCADLISARLLQQGRDAVLRTGVSARFHLLRDVLEGIAPPTPVYLFLNAFCLSAEDRIRLHARLAQEQACAIWVYAPGYFGPVPDVANIQATTGMDVRVFEGLAKTGSKYILTGEYMQADQNFGTGEPWSPLFYIAPKEDTDLLAKYLADETKGSIAMLTFPEGWTSLFIAEPDLSPALLSQLLRLLEQHIYSSPTEAGYYDAIFAREPLFALHASKAGKRSLVFGGFYDVKDLLDPDIGWFQKDSVLIPLRGGETRLLLQREVYSDTEQ